MGMLGVSIIAMRERATDFSLFNIWTNININININTIYVIEDNR